MMKIKETLGVIGIGHMGSAIVEGILAKKMRKPSQIWIYDRDLGKARFFSKKTGVHLASSNREVVEKSQVLLLAVKPQDLRETAAEFCEALRPEHWVISILAGTPVQKLQSILGRRVRVVRAMPNLGAEAGASMTVMTGTKMEGLTLAEQLFSGCGKTLRLPEKYFDLVTAVSGSGPAYFFLLMEILAASAVRRGLAADKAETLAVQTALGASLLALQSGISPAELRKRVTSKGGTTQAALEVLESAHLADLMDHAVAAALERGRELSRA